jgi:hypothetical protein
LQLHLARHLGAQAQEMADKELGIQALCQVVSQVVL